MRIKTAVILGLCVCLAYATSLVAGDRAAYSATRLPGVRVLGSLSEQYAPVTFDHPKHVAIAGSCAACHHHGNGNTSSCRECHALSPSVFKSSVVHSFMPCSNCHGAPDPENPAMPGLKVAYHKKCFECHRGMGDVGLDPKGCTELCHAGKSQSAALRVRP